jgi:hypothetical protein
MTIISYYDKIDEFNFNDQNKTFNWAMPFDWNTTRLESTSIFVHEEVRIPKTMQGIGDAPAFKATVNSFPISSGKVVLDPYASEKDLTVHYLLNKPDILSLAGKVSQTDDQMTFTLKPSSGVENTTTSEMSTDTGGVHVGLQWSPNPLDSGTSSTVDLTFSDAFSGKRIDTSDIHYALRIIDKSGSVVYSKDDLVAKGGKGSAAVDFPKDDNYRIEVQVKGIQRDGGSLDTTRSGVARGMVVVPEFPAAAAVAVAGVVAALVAARRLATGQGLFKGSNR